MGGWTASQCKKGKEEGRKGEWRKNTTQINFLSLFLPTLLPHCSLHVVQQRNGGPQRVVVKVSGLLSVPFVGLSVVSMQSSLIFLLGSEVERHRKVLSCYFSRPPRSCESLKSQIEEGGVCSRDTRQGSCKTASLTKRAGVHHARTTGLLPSLQRVLPWFLVFTRLS